MPDYSKGKIYRLICNITGDQYIGSTTQSLAKRLGSHVANAKNENHTQFTSKSIIDRGNFSIVLIEDCPCENKSQLERRERYFIESMECVNKIIPTRTKSEYYEDNRDRMLVKYHKYYENNRDRMLVKQHQYYEDNRDRMLVKQHQYDQSHKEQRSEYNRQRYLRKKAQHPPAYRALQDAEM
jgi:group I intron endonuclease